jgi:exportin-2 (importin alpha re-exporter)
MPEHSMNVIRLIASNETDPAARQAAAVHFKNIIKHGWPADSDSDRGTGIVISPADRLAIKSHIVQLMCTVPHAIQLQCSEAVALIAAHDFPQAWDHLLPDLIGQLQPQDAQDLSVVQGVLLTCNSIFKRFRYTERSDALYQVILYVLNKFQQPLLTLFQTMAQGIDAASADVGRLKARFACMNSMMKIYYSLIYQDLPEYFEDNIETVMAIMAKFLTYNNTLLVDDEEETEPSPVDVLQAAIVDILNHYADKDEECFLPFLPDFTKMVWALLMNVTSHPKHDALAVTCIRFLANLVKKLMHKHLFEQESTLREIIGRIVIPNMMVRDVDEERFEDDPQEFIQTDMEGSETDSRRKCSLDLAKAMCRQFEAQTTLICTDHISSMIAEYTNDPNQWARKDAAIYLMFGIAIKAESAVGGVSEVNANVNVLQFFSTNIYPELEDTNHMTRPMLKATALKFVGTFRNQFTKEQLIALMPLLIHHLGSPSVVVHSYAAYGIEKIMTTKQDGRPKFGAPELQPFLQTIFTALFNIIDNPNLNENEYAMKCVMRSLAVASDDILPVTQVVLERITSALGRVAKNPRNPQYNHYMFESIAVLVKSVCTKEPAATSAFESFLFPPFQTVLQMDVSEFTPYVFQIFALLLEFRPVELGLGESYEMLFQPMLTPEIWERKGNIPALTRLLRAYLGQASAKIVAMGSLPAILGLFQKLIASQATEQSGFELLSTVLLKVDATSLKPFVTEIFRILFLRLRHKKTTRLTRLLAQCFALYVGKLGSASFFDSVNAVQDGLALNVLMGVWLPQVESDPPARLDAKIQLVGLTELMCTTPALFATDQAKQLWAKALAAAMKLLASDTIQQAGVGVDVPEEIEISYDSAFSSLSFARRPVEDPFPEINDPAAHFAQKLYALSTQHPGQLTPIISQGLDPKLSGGLEAILKHAGVMLV